VRVRRLLLNHGPNPFFHFPKPSGYPGGPGRDGPFQFSAAS
jgi:hypothetical protein